MLGGCRVYLTTCEDYEDALAHELGHTLGLRHGAARTPSGVDDYEDRSTVMGYSYPNAPRRGLNAVHRLTIGMRDGNALDVAAGFSGTLTLNALHMPDVESTPLVKVAMINTPTRYYLSFRSNVPGSYESDLAHDLGGIMGKIKEEKKGAFFLLFF